MTLGHLGLLAGLAGPPGAGRPSQPGGSSATPTERPPALQVSVRHRPADAGPAAPAEAAPAGPAIEAAAARAPAAEASDAASTVPGAVHSAALPAPRSEAGSDAPARPSEALPAPRTGSLDEEYLPRSALSLAPEALGEVLLAYPPEAPPGRYGGVLTLFIDADGGVRRVRSEPARPGEADLPPVFEEAARQAFLAARFRPGERDGRPVKSRIRIAVEFEAQAAPPSVEERGVR